FSRSADGGQLADTATRVFKIILESPNEQIDIMSAVGVQIGDPYSASNTIPCVSVEGRADGESRLVRIVTCQYRTSAMVDGEGGTGLPDPMLVMPDVRPANFSTSTSLYEAPAYYFKKVGRDVAFKPACNALGDMIDGITQMLPITTIRVTQFNFFPGTIFSGECGKINMETMTLGSYLTCKPNTVLFRGVEAAPHVETFGTMTYRGFMNSYEFAYRPNRVDIPGYLADDFGWDVVLPHTGYNVKSFTPSSTTDKEVFAQPLKHQGGKVVVPFALMDGILAGTKVRAMVPVHDTEDGGVRQQPSAQPVALNDDGTPRASNSDPPVKLWRIQVQEQTNLTQFLQLRLS
ncbi:MAG: hypothetical protein EBR82_75170, partial [Caulobacteraceae bacterium]|nr:hypothetical protein [Caulobacteraceae bacterium]